MRRFKDPSAHIRSLCVECIANLMIVMPDLFLNEIYLKYLVWSLMDRKSSDDCLFFYNQNNVKISFLGKFLTRPKSRNINNARNVRRRFV